ncbi:hypothetical protein HOB36_03645 [Candidatus Bathyarchaeota archaeon]|nr:hypothetical protein [Candidatus Bathyarchaeota archaeon]
MSEEYRANSLWHILVETAKTLPMYNSHMSYARDKILPESPTITPEQLSQRLNMPLGEAIVILEELRSG